MTSSAVENVPTLPIPIKLGTHNGTFHCDEALAIWMLSSLSMFENATIVRSRSPKELDSCEVVVDVGGVYLPSEGRYDHHQRGFNETLSPHHKIKLSSAGLIYKHFGREVIQQIIGTPLLSQKTLDILYFHIYKGFVACIDGIDNGIKQYKEGGSPDYVIKTDLSARVGYLNPEWHEQVNEEQMMMRFQKAVQLTGQELTDHVMRAYKSWIPARQCVYDAVNDLTNNHNQDSSSLSNEILILKSYVPWKSHLFQVEEELKVSRQILFVIYENPLQQQWMVHTVPLPNDNFKSRLMLHETWRGLSGQPLLDISQISDANFVHSAGFIGSASSLEGACRMATKTIELYRNL
ncbi:MAG: hypothetical protein Sylvanvirus7_7 [Sylvanvirus sp.]|uniref:Metal-dependent protein hydrolase n=1 Tax=Sylvanvirus sp. TaxID=2487774 RepID=A0A3G5AL73_9VIRU|nr:MAG: hypothetical protein Sylvanvirus7_7 [Sylvanvirus sp.]